MTSRAQDSDPVRATPTGPEATPTTPDAGTAPAASDDIGELEREIEQAREQLGETVEALAAKVDVSKRAQDKVAELKGRAGQAQRAAVQGAGRAAQQAQRAAVQGASAAKQRRWPLAAAAAGALTAALGYLAIRRWRKR